MSLNIFNSTAPPQVLGFWIKSIYWSFGTSNKFLSTSVDSKYWPNNCLYCNPVISEKLRWSKLYPIDANKHELSASTNLLVGSINLILLL